MEKRIESLYRVGLLVQNRFRKFIQSVLQNFKLFLRAKTDYDKDRREVSSIESLPPQIKTHCTRVVEQLAGIDQVDQRINHFFFPIKFCNACAIQLLADRGTRYLLGPSMTEYDCELMPRLHHMRIIGQRLLK